MNRIVIKQILITIIMVGLLAALATADTIKLKDGRVLTGYYQGGSPRSVKFLVNGQTQDISVGDIVSLSFGEIATTQVVKPQTQPALVSGTVTLPAGTRMILKTTSPIGTKTHKKGSKFTVILDIDLVANGVVVAPKGSTVYGKVIDARGGKRIGKTYLHLTFTDIRINNQLVPIITDQIGLEGGGGGALRTVGAGALIGGAMGNAGKGAMVAGGLKLLGPGNHIAIPVGTIGEVRTKQPVTIQI